MKTLLYIAIILFVFYGANTLFISQENNTSTGTWKIAAASDIDMLSLNAIKSNNPELCNNFKLAMINIAQYTEDEIKRTCNKSYTKAIEDRTVENIRFESHVLSKEASSSYSLPKNWGAYVNNQDYTCLNVYKPYPLLKEENLFLVICVKPENNLKNYVSSLGLSTNKRAVSVDNIEVTVFDSSNGDRRYIFMKNRKLYDAQYTYKELVQSQYDEKRILEIINRIK
ncbi:MAG: hypothetical protein V4686_01960 [Patescibacteria group bacterium]